jgi:hypothetical protein
MGTEPCNDALECIDAMVFRIPHGWIAGKDVTEQTLNETVHFARTILSVKSIIFVAMFFNNNVPNDDSWKDLQEGNERLRAFAANDPEIMVLDMDQFLHPLIQQNAFDLGLTPHTNSTSWINVSIYERHGTAKHPQSVPQTCAEQVVQGTCQRNLLSLDGMHLCMETLGGRINAAIACLLGCAFNDDAPKPISLDQCEHDCNQKFMRPGTTLFLND